MRKRNWIWLLAIVLCLGAFFGYRAMDAIRTDTRPPEIQVDDSILEASVQAPKSTLTEGMRATDREDGDVTDSLVVESIGVLGSDGTVSVTYAAFDAAGNVAKATRQVRFVDYHSPRFVLESPMIYTFNSNFDVLSTIGAQDVLDGDIQHRVRATAMEEASITVTGVHPVQFQVTNTLGDTQSYVFPVEVLAPNAYDAKLELTDYLIYMPVGTNFDPYNYLLSYTLRGEETTLNYRLPQDFTLKTKGTVQTQQPGCYTVEFRLVYTDRHPTNPDLDKEYVGYSKLIVIVEG